MYKKRQNAWKAPCMAKRHNIKKKKKCILSVYERVRHQNAEKKQEKLPIRENRIALSKTYVLSVSEILTYQNAKIHVKHLLRKNRITTRNHVLCFFFFLSLCTKTPKFIQSTLYVETKGHYEKRA